MTHLIRESDIFDAARTGNVERVAEILDAGVDPNVQDIDGHRTPLHFACAHGHKKVVELLVRRGADLSVQDGSEQTPLHQLVMNKMDVLAIWLVHQGASLRVADRKGFTALDYGLPSTQKALLEAASAVEGVKVDQKDAEPPKLYRVPSVASAERHRFSERTEEVRVSFKDTAIKTIRVGPSVSAVTLAKMAAEKFSIPASYFRYVSISESARGVKRKLQNGENILNIVSNWPKIIKDGVNQTNVEFFFILSCTAMAPKDVLDFFGVAN